MDQEKLEAYTRCDCDWIDMSPELPCGCGQENARLYRDDVIHWRDQHWRLECALREALRELARKDEAIAYHMKKAQDEHIKWSGACYDQKTANADLRYKIGELEEEQAKVQRLKALDEMSREAQEQGFYEEEEQNG